MFRFIVLFLAATLIQGCFGTRYHWDAASQVREDAANAANGDITAQYNLGDALFNGTGVQKDVTKAREIFEKIANMDARSASGNNKLIIRAAQYNMGEIYHQGNGVPADDRQAIFWLEKATEEGLFHQSIDQCYDLLGGIYASSTEDELRDPHKAFKCATLAASYGNPSGKTLLGTLYELGIGVERDYDKAFQLYSDSANAGWIPGKISVADSYMLGHGVSKDYDQARSMYEDIISKGADVIKLRLAYMAYNGFGESKNIDKAKILIKEGSKAISADRLFGIGKSMKYGICDIQDASFAKYILQDACRRGNQKACAELKK